MFSSEDAEELLQAASDGWHNTGSIFSFKGQRRIAGEKDATLCGHREGHGIIEWPTKESSCNGRANLASQKVGLAIP